MDPTAPGWITLKEKLQTTRGTIALTLTSGGEPLRFESRQLRFIDEDVILIESGGKQVRYVDVNSIVMVDMQAD